MAFQMATLGTDKSRSTTGYIVSNGGAILSALVVTHGSTAGNWKIASSSGGTHVITMGHAAATPSKAGVTVFNIDPPLFVKKPHATKTGSAKGILTVIFYKKQTT